MNFGPVHRLEWKVISLPPIKENMYEISNNGIVRNINTGLSLSTCIINSGYETVNLRCVDSYKGKAFLMHRLVAFHFVPNPTPERNTVNHKYGDKLVNGFYNLEWMTQGENNSHAKHTGLNKGIGGTHYLATLTEDQVRTICQLLQSGFKYKDILDFIGLDSSDPYGNNYDLIGNIKRRIAWVHISNDYTFRDFNKSMFTDDQIHEICRCLVEKFTIPETITKVTGIVYIYSEHKKYYEAIRRIKTRQQMTHISSQYDF